MRRFWFNQLILLLLGVALPTAGMLYVDAQLALKGGDEAAERIARRAEHSLTTSLTAEKQARLTTAIVAATRIGAADTLARLDGRRTREEALAQLQTQLKQLKPAGGYALLVGAEGEVLGAAPEAPPSGSSVFGHPLFSLAMGGEAVLGLWQGTDHFAAVAPVADEGVTAGALVIVWRRGPAELKALASGAGASLTVLYNGALAQSTLPAAEAKALASATLPGFSGDRPEPLATIGPLPLFVDRKLTGRAFYSTEHKRGVEGDWLVTVPVEGGLSGLAERQKNTLAVFAVAALFVILVGMMQSRVFVRPIGIIAEHLSSVTMGNGETELPEVRVSGPFRRLVRLVNMAVQKMPRGGMSTVPGGELARLRTDGGGSTPLPAPSAIDGLALTPAPVPPSSDIIPSADLMNLSGAYPMPDPMVPLQNAAAAVPPNDEHAAAIADAINSLNQAESTSGTVESMPPVSSLPMGDASGVRGGGSLDQPSAGLGAAPVPSESEQDRREKTVVATVSPDLLAQTAEGAPLPELSPAVTQPPVVDGTDDGLDDADRAHFREVYERFIDTRRRCGENTGDLSYDRFAKKLMKNRAALIEKYACRTVRFQVHEKNGKAALKATPVRSRG